MRRQSMAVAGIVDGSENLKTILRIRPVAGIDIYDDDYLEVNEERIIVKNEAEEKAEIFNFDNILQPEATQQETFDASTTDLVRSSLTGSNGCLFTYGASGSGKTHTIMGGKGKECGMLPRAVSTIFNAIGNQIDTSVNLIPIGSSRVNRATAKQIRDNTFIKSDLMALANTKRHGVCKNKRNSILKVDAAIEDEQLAHSLNFTAPEGKYVLFVTFVEIYNEKCFDLLQKPETSGRREELQIRQDSSGTYVDNCRHVQVNTPLEALKLIEAGRKNLTVAQTKLNNDSSRSHCIFTVRICYEVRPSKWRVSSMAFCDLAGVERRKKLGRFGSARSNESKNINKSLMQLRIVIRELKLQQARPGSVAVSFRNSNLTRLMQTYLTGNSSTRIIVTISNDPQFREETQQSLEFASTASTISMGRDRHGGRSKSTGLNLSELKPESHPDNTECSTFNIKDFNTWSKEDLIADLKYYIEGKASDHDLILKLKNGWKQDEIQFKQERMSWQKTKRDLGIDVYNLRAEKYNELHIMADKCFEEKKELRKQLKEAQMQPSTDLDQQKALEDLVLKLDQELANVKIELSDEKTKNQISKTEYEELQRELNQHDTISKGQDKDEMERMIQHLKESYEECHQRLIESEELTRQQSEQISILSDTNASLEKMFRVKNTVTNDTLDMMSTLQIIDNECVPQNNGHEIHDYEIHDDKIHDDKIHDDEIHENKEAASATLVNKVMEEKLENMQVKMDELISSHKCIVADLQGKLDRSILRKQKVKALKQLEDEKLKVQKLERLLCQHEESVSKSSTHTFKQEPTDPCEQSSLPSVPKIKAEPVDYYEQSIPASTLPAPTQARSARKLASNSPDPLDASTEPETLPTYRSTRSRLRK